ncbi:MAG: hypothetical protein C0404_10530 [Verrucomicrobia bacterium]|nr:hypothetical protein [Verrucomicrobiota bacterium]
MDTAEGSGSKPENVNQKACRWCRGPVNQEAAICPNCGRAQAATFIDRVKQDYVVAMQLATVVTGAALLMGSCFAIHRGSSLAKEARRSFCAAVDASIAASNVMANADRTGKSASDSNRKSDQLIKAADEMFERAQSLISSASNSAANASNALANANLALHESKSVSSNIEDLLTLVAWDSNSLDELRDAAKKNPKLDKALSALLAEKESTVYIYHALVTAGHYSKFPRYSTKDYVEALKNQTNHTMRFESALGVLNEYRRARQNKTDRVELVRAVRDPLLKNAAGDLLLPRMAAYYVIGEIYESEGGRMSVPQFSNKEGASNFLSEAHSFFQEFPKRVL